MRGPASVSTLLLRNVPLFSQLPEGQLALLTRVVGRKAFPRSSTIISAGDPTDSLYIVIAGRLKVMMSDDEGREVILAILSSGEFFGEMGLVDDAVGVTQALHQATHYAHANVEVLGQAFLEIGFRDGEELTRLDRDHGCRSRRIIDQPHFAEEFTG